MSMLNEREELMLPNPESAPPLPGQLHPGLTADRSFFETHTDAEVKAYAAAPFTEDIFRDDPSTTDTKCRRALKNTKTEF